jgi:hypothetical protein
MPDYKPAKRWYNLKISMGEVWGGFGQMQSEVPI